MQTVFTLFARQVCQINFPDSIHVSLRLCIGLLGLTPCILQPMLDPEPAAFVSGAFGPLFDLV